MQHSVIDIIGKLSEEDYGLNSYFEKARIWLEADKSYPKDNKTVSGYDNNALEADAREFAEGLVRKYGFEKKQAVF